MNEALDALRVYEVGKPLVIEEIFPLKCSGEEALEFITRSQSHADGWISFYWGETADQCQASGKLGDAITSAWLKQFRASAPKQQ